MELADGLSLPHDHLIVDPVAGFVGEISLHVDELRTRQFLEAGNVANDVNALLNEVHLLLAHKFERVLIDASEVAIRDALDGGCAHFAVDEGELAEPLS